MMRLAASIQRGLSRMERSEIRDTIGALGFPDFASLHPGYAAL
jgi:hypothetical protein